MFSFKFQSDSLKIEDFEITLLTLSTLYATRGTVKIMQDCLLMAIPSSRAYSSRFSQGPFNSFFNCASIFFLKTEIFGPYLNFHDTNVMVFWGWNIWSFPKFLVYKVYVLVLWKENTGPFISFCKQSLCNSFVKK